LVPLQEDISGLTCQN